MDERTRQKTLEGQARQAKIRAKIQENVKKRAREERFDIAPPLTYRPPNYTPDLEKPRYVIRAVYGPISGLTASVIAAFEYDEMYLERRLPVGIQARPLRLVRRDGELHFENFAEDGAITRPGETIYLPHDPFGAWGPRQFLYEVFKMAALLHGDCVIYLVHNGQEVRVDPTSFRQWVEQSQTDPVAALLAPAALLLPENPTTP